MSDQDNRRVAQARALFKVTAGDLIKDDEVNDLYARLDTFVVALDDDPLAYGPKRIQHKMAQCRQMLDEVGSILLQVGQQLHQAKRKHRAAAGAFDLAKKYLFATDPETRAGRNVADREAMAAIKLQDEWKDLHRLEQQTQDLDAILVMVKIKRGDLRDTQSRLRDQVRLCQTEIELGGRWGSRVPGKTELEPGQGFASDEDIQSIEALIAEAEAVHAEVDLPDLEDEDEGDGEDAETVEVPESEEPEPVPEPTEPEPEPKVEDPAQTPVPGKAVKADFSDLQHPDEVFDLADLIGDAQPATPPEPAPDKSVPDESKGRRFNDGKLPKETPSEPEPPEKALPGNGLDEAKIDGLLGELALPVQRQEAPGTTQVVEDDDLGDLLDVFAE